MIIEAKDDTFAKVVSAPRVLVDFWAPSCAPCHVLSRELAKKEPSYEGHMIFCKVNVDEAQDTAVEYGIRGLPVLALFKDGQLVDTRVGAVLGAKLDALLKEWATL